jgi:hypothetical protein
MKELPLPLISRPRFREGKLPRESRLCQTAWTINGAKARSPREFTLAKAGAGTSGRRDSSFISFA